MTPCHARRVLRRAMLTASAILAIGAVLVDDALAADLDRGRTLARRWCAACHIVAADQTHGQDAVPPFATIAKIPGFNADAIGRFLMNPPHPKAPDMQMQLSRPDAEDLAAYIVSLGK